MKKKLNYETELSSLHATSGAKDSQEAEVASNAHL